MKTSNIIITAIVLFFFAISLTAMIEIRNNKSTTDEGSSCNNKEHAIKEPFSVIFVQEGKTEIVASNENKINCCNNSDYKISNDTLIINTENNVKIEAVNIKSVVAKSRQRIKLKKIKTGNFSIKLTNTYLDCDRCNIDTLYIKLKDSRISGIFNDNKTKSMFIDADNSNVYFDVKTEKCKIKYRNESNVTIGSTKDLEVKSDDKTCMLHVMR